MERLPGLTIPHNDRLALIGYSNRIRSDTGGFYCRTRSCNGAFEYLRCIVLDPAGLWEVLSDLTVSAANNLAPR
jgi:hypothetical protein